jgi:hypothetical protein
MRAIEIEIKEAFKCAHTLDCLPLSMKRAKRKEWLEDKELYSVLINVGNRIMTPITIKPKKEGEEENTSKKDSPIYLMDVVTGTLYNPKTKECLTSDSLKIMSYEIDLTKGKQVLDLKVEKEE